MKRNRKKLCAAVYLAWAVFALWCAAAEYLLPHSAVVLQGERYSCFGGLLTARAAQSDAPQTAATAGSSYEAQLMLLDAIPLKTVRVSVSEQLYLIPGGEPFGIKLFTEGVMVVGLGKVQTQQGNVSPAEQAGIRKGDVILSIDGQKVGSNEAVAAVVAQSGGAALQVQLLRGGVQHTVKLSPALDRGGSGWKAGFWVRDSSAGLGTLTYIDEQQGFAAGLGHGITDTDTGQLVPVSSGQFVSVNITGAAKGQVGTPGELHGSFAGGSKLADLAYNCERGVYGVVARQFWKKAALPVAFRQKVHTGKAQILCTVQGREPAYYSVEILSLNLSDSAAVKNIVLRVTDRRLLEQTGGIVQGMSGSPIIQDGCIIGAVTHVFLKDPTRGYGIFIENMLSAQGEAKLTLQRGEAA